MNNLLIRGNYNACKPFQKHLVKYGCRFVESDPTQEKGTVIEEKIVAFEGFFIPHDRDGE